MNLATFMTVLNWVIARLKEPSTIISLGFALAYFHVPVTQTALQMGIDGARDIMVGTSIILGMVMSEKPVATILPVPSPDRALVVAN